MPCDLSPKAGVRRNSPVLARLYVNVLMLTAAALLEADPADPTADQGIVAEALIQLRLISVGRLHWTAER